MRKRLKNKKKSCGLCKPHKRGISNRWTKQEEVKLLEWEKQKNECEKTS